MKKRNTSDLVRRTGIASSLVIAALTAPAIGYSADIAQTVNSANSSTPWNAALWGSPAAVPAAGNTYVTATGFFASAANNLGVNVTGRVRAYAASPTFLGDSLRVIANTELLTKDNVTANIILDGGAVRFSPDTGGPTAPTLSGTLDVASDSYLGLASTVTTTFTVNSTLTGSSILHLAAGTGTGTPVLTLAFGGTLSGFSGIFDIGGGTGGASATKAVKVDFNQDYNLTLAGMKMGDHGTTDTLVLDQALTFGSFSFGGSSLAAGTYDATTLNGLFGNGSQFSGPGSLTIAAVPEPGSAALASLAGGILFLLRRRQKQ